MDWDYVVQWIGRILIGALWAVPVFLLLALAAFLFLAPSLFLAGVAIRILDLFRGRPRTRVDTTTSGPSVDGTHSVTTVPTSRT